MKQRSLLGIWVAGAVLLLGVLAAAADEMAKPPAAAGPVNPSFERLKSLAGEWTGTAPEGGGGDSVIASYRVTANGSAVVETLFPGSPHEMVTVYYLDGKDLVLTHYCAMGNQPHMKAAPSKDGAKLDFRFAGGSNIRPAKDPHMHGVRITLTDPDHLRSEWDVWEGGKKKDTKVFELERKKA